MSALHTPGPWLEQNGTVYALDETGNCNRFSVRVEGGWTSRAFGKWADANRTSEAELSANARLIAAAPDLLEALERYTAAVRSLGERPEGRSDTYFEAPLLETDDGWRRWEELDRAGKVAAAVLAKATGAA